MLSVVLVPMILAGSFDLHSRETRGAGKECVRRDAEPRGDGAAEELALARDDVEGGGCAHVDDDGRAAEKIERGDAVHDAVRADFAGVVREHGQAGLHAGLDEERADLEVGLAETAQARVQRRHDGRNRNAGDEVGLEAAHGEERLKEDSEFVGRLLVGCGDTPDGGELCGFGFRREPEETHDRVGVAYVECQ